MILKYSHPIYFIIKQKTFWILGFGSGIKIYDNLFYIFDLTTIWFMVYPFSKVGEQHHKRKRKYNRNSSNTKENKIFNFLKPSFACKIHISAYYLASQRPSSLRI